MIFPLSANLQHLRLENIRFFRCLPTSDTFVRKTYQILGVNPPLIHSFSNYILHELCGKCNYNLFYEPLPHFIHHLFVSFPVIAEALETIRERLIIIQYQLLHNESQSYSLVKKINSGSPVFKEYYDVKQLLNQKTAEKKELSQQKKNTGFFNPIRHIQLSQQITTLTEEIEELKNQKTSILIRLGCDKESDIKIAESNLKKMNETVEKLLERQKTLEQQKTDETAKFHKWKSQVSPEQELELLDERISLRENHHNSLIGKLQDFFGRIFSYERLRDASEEIDYHLNENPDIIRKRTWEKRYMQAQEKVHIFLIRRRNPLVI